MLVVAELNSSILPRLGMVARFLVAGNVMFSGKQTTARKMADQLTTVLIKEHMGFTVTAYILQAHCELLTL